MQPASACNSLCHKVASPKRPMLLMQMHMKVRSFWSNGQHLCMHADMAGMSRSNDDRYKGLAGRPSMCLSVRRSSLSRTAAILHTFICMDHACCILMSNAVLLRSERPTSQVVYRSIGAGSRCVLVAAACRWPISSKFHSARAWAAWQSHIRNCDCGINLPKSVRPGEVRLYTWNAASLQSGLNHSQVQTNPA